MELTRDMIKTLESDLNAHGIRFDDETRYIVGIKNNPSNPENVGEEVYLMDLDDLEERYPGVEYFEVTEKTYSLKRFELVILTGGTPEMVCEQDHIFLPADPDKAIVPYYELPPSLQKIIQRKSAYRLGVCIAIVSQGDKEFIVTKTECKGQMHRPVLFNAEISTQHNKAIKAIAPNMGRGARTKYWLDFYIKYKRGKIV